MLSLEQGQGRCHGLAFRIAADAVHAETAILWRREMLRGGYAPALLPMLTPQGPIQALAFVSNPSHSSYVGELPFAETARLIASGKGILGTNREYLVQLAMQPARWGSTTPMSRSSTPRSAPRRMCDAANRGCADVAAFQTMFERRFPRANPAS